MLSELWKIITHSDVLYHILVGAFVAFMFVFLLEILIITAATTWLFKLKTMCVALLQLKATCVALLQLKATCVALLQLKTCVALLKLKACVALFQLKATYVALLQLKATCVALLQLKATNLSKDVVLSRGTRILYTYIPLPVCLELKLTDWGGRHRACYLQCTPSITSIVYFNRE